MLGEGSISPAYRLGKAESGVPPEAAESKAPKPGPGTRELGWRDDADVGGGRKNVSPWELRR